MAPPGGGRAGVHGKSESIRAKSGTKRRFNAAASNPFGGGPSASSSSSLASSLSSLFQPAPHGKDAALAALLASSSRPAYDLTAAAKRAKTHGLGLSALEEVSSQSAAADAVRPKLLTDKGDKGRPGPFPAASAAAAPPLPATASIDQAAAKIAPKQADALAPPIQRGTSAKTEACHTAAPSSASHAAALNLLQGTSASPSPRGTPQPPLHPRDAATTSAIAASSAKAGSSNVSINSSAAPWRLSTPQLTAPPLPASRKPVFRPVLNSPLMVNWPDLPQAASQTILHTLLDLLKHPQLQPQLAASFGGSRSKGKGKGKGEAQGAYSKGVKATQERSTKRQRTAGEEAPAHAAKENKAEPWFIAGLNSTTRLLERSVQWSIASSSSSSTTSTSASTGDTPSPTTTITHLFVCRHDISPPTLASHYPMLACSVNAICHPASPSSSNGLRLVPLPLSSAPLLAEAVGLHSLTVLALTSHLPSHLLGPLHNAVSTASSATPPRSHTVLRSDWMESAVAVARSVGPQAFPLVPSLPPSDSEGASRREGTVYAEAVPPSIKLLRTTQPADLNACRVKKRKKRAERSLKSRRKRELDFLAARRTRLTKKVSSGMTIKPRRTNSKQRREVLTSSEKGLSEKARRVQRRRQREKAKLGQRKGKDKTALTKTSSA